MSEEVESASNQISESTQEVVSIVDEVTEISAATTDEAGARRVGADEVVVPEVVSAKHVCSGL